MNKITAVYFDLLHIRTGEVSKSSARPVYPAIKTLHQTGSILVSFLDYVSALSHF